MHSCIYLFPFERLCVLHSITQFELSVALPLLQAVAWSAFRSFIEENGMSVFIKIISGKLSLKIALNEIVVYTKKLKLILKESKKQFHRMCKHIKVMLHEADKTIDSLALDFKLLIVDNYIKENLKFFKSLAS